MNYRSEIFVVQYGANSIIYDKMFFIPPHVIKRLYKIEM